MGEPQPLVLRPNRQRWIVGDVEIMANTLEQLFEGKAIEKLGDQVAFVRDAKLRRWSPAGGSTSCSWLSRSSSGRRTQNGCWQKP